MPEVYKFDNYEECIGSNDLYCVVNSFIRPDDSSELYQYIKKISDRKKVHLRHDKLQRGLCINKCESKLTQKANGSKNYFVENFPMDSKVNSLMMW
jgi:hypothetical protein